MLTLFHDYTTPASAIAALRLQRLAAGGAAVAFEPFDAFGVDAALPVTVDVLAAMDALAVESTSEGLAWRRPRFLPPTAAAHLVGALADEAGVGASWRDRCYRAFWEDGADIADADVLEELARASGVAGVKAALSERGRLASLRRRMAAHRATGVGGVPTLLAHRTLVPGLLSEDDLRALL